MNNQFSLTILHTAQHMEIIKAGQITLKRAHPRALAPRGQSWRARRPHTRPTGTRAPPTGAPAACGRGGRATAAGRWCGRFGWTP